MVNNIVNKIKSIFNNTCTTCKKTLPQAYLSAENYKFCNTTCLMDLFKDK